MNHSARNKERQKRVDKREDNSKQSPEDQSRESKAIAKRGEHRTDDKREADWPSWIQAISAVGIVIITFYYTYYAGQQVQETRKAIALSDDSIKLDQRAWMGVAYVVGKPEVGKPLIVKVVFKNTGKTPAKNVTIAATAEPIYQKKGRPDFAHEKSIPRISRGLVAPQAEVFSILSDPKSGNINEAVLKAIKAAEVRICIHGVLDYDDIFTQHHWVTFCYCLGTNAENYDAYEEYNNTDNS
jgi:hypothetical protein